VTILAAIPCLTETKWTRSLTMLVKVLTTMVANLKGKRLLRWSPPMGI
jgi:hypothetical protein